MYEEIIQILCIGGLLPDLPDKDILMISPDCPMDPPKVD